MTKPKHGHSPWLIGVVVINLALSWYGLYELGTKNLHMAPLFAAVLSVALDMAVLGFARQALRQAAAQESTLVPNVLTVAIALLSAYANAARASLDHLPTVGVIVFGAFPVLALVLWETDLRFVSRQTRRDERKLAPPRPRMEPLRWLLFPRATWHAFRYGVLHRGLTSESAMAAGMAAARSANPDYGLPPINQDSLTPLTVDAERAGPTDLAGPAGSVADTSDLVTGRVLGIMRPVLDSVRADVADLRNTLTALPPGRPNSGTGNAATVDQTAVAPPAASGTPAGNTSTSGDDPNDAARQSARLAAVPNTQADLVRHMVRQGVIDPVLIHKEAQRVFGTAANLNTIKRHLRRAVNSAASDQGTGGYL